MIRLAVSIRRNYWAALNRHFHHRSSPCYSNDALVLVDRRMHSASGRNGRDYIVMRSSDFGPIVSPIGIQRSRPSTRGDMAGKPRQQQQPKVGALSRMKPAVPQRRR